MKNDSYVNSHIAALGLSADDLQAFLNDEARKSGQVYAAAMAERSKRGALNGRGVYDLLTDSTSTSGEHVGAAYLSGALAEVQRRMASAAGLTDCTVADPLDSHSPEFLDGAACAAWFAGQLLDPRMEGSEALRDQLVEERDSGRSHDWLRGYCAGVDRLLGVQVDMDGLSADQRQQMAIRLAEARAVAVADEAVQAADRAEEMAEAVARLKAEAEALALGESRNAMASLIALCESLTACASESVRAAAMVMALTEAR